MISRPRVGALLGLALLLAHAAVAVAAPANPEAFVIQQPDGTPFVARQFGDEWMNGTETVDGYTVVKDAASGYWSYADVTQAGTLVASPYVVGRDLPYALPQFVRPAVNPSSPALSGAQSFGIDQPDLVPFTGTRKMLVILVRFANQTSSTTAANWQSRFFGTSNSVTDFYTRTSYGNLTIVPAAETHGTANDGIVGWVNLPTNHPNFGGNIQATNAQVLAADAMTAASAFVDYASFDTDANGVLSESELLVIIIVAGNEASFGPPCSPNVWGHRWGVAGGVSLDGKILSPYAMFGERHCATTNTAAAAQATLGIIVHETGHLLGLPDLYDTDGSSEGVGKWSVMGAGSWNKRPVAGSRSGDSPSFMDPWSKYTLGWVTPTLVTGTLAGRTIPDAATNAKVFKFLTGTEYFLLENRNQASYDAGLPGRGLLIWHIDDAMPNDGFANREECSPGGVAGLPACSTSVHPKVRLIQADNLYDLENASDQGDTGDPFPGSTGRTAFTNTSTPNSRTYSGAASNVSVTAISAPGASMTATLSVAAAASITVTAPNGGEAWATGVVQTITWTSVNVTGDVKIELSRDGGATWTTLFAATPNDGARTWNAANPATSQARIRVCSVTTPSLCDTSNASFLLGRSILLTTPNGGQTWTLATSRDIKWKSSMLTGNVKIDISRNAGSTWATLFASVANTGTRAWTVAGATTTKGRIKVCSISTPVICDKSDTNFTINGGGTVDLVALSMSYGSSAIRGGTWPIGLTVQNTGTGTAVASKAKVYFSSDLTFTTGDHLITSFSIPQLGPGASKTVSKDITFPTTVPAGSYWLVVRLDTANVVAETNENNWYYVSAAQVPVTAPPAPGEGQRSPAAPALIGPIPLSQH